MNDEFYQESLKTAIDIIEHLPTLKKLAEEADTVLELGVREGHSTAAFLAGKPMRLVSVDIKPHPRPQRMIGAEGFEYVIKDSREYDSSDGFDLMFIDTCHQYEILKAELEAHHSNIKDRIAFHDTVTFGYKDEFTGAEGGLMKAINEFLAAHPEWQVEKVYENNNGLTVLKRVSK